MTEQCNPERLNMMHEHIQREVTCYAGADANQSRNPGTSLGSLALCAELCSLHPDYTIDFTISYSCHCAAK